MDVLFYSSIAEEKGIQDVLVRVVVSLGVRDGLQVLKVLIIVNVFPQMYMGILERKHLLMIEGDLSDWMSVLLKIPGMS